MKVELRDIHKHFGPVRANDGISLTIEGGSIFGLLGENGAGKSTLMKVLSGFISADSGAILLDGQPVRYHSPADAIRHGVGMLHQDPLDFPPMRLIENLVTGRDNRLSQQRRSAESAFRQLCRQFDFDLDPHALVADLTVGERQQLEIVRLLWLGVRTLILDEPTTGITTPQKVKLFATLKQLAAEGKTILFVSHKLEDVEELCSRVAVLRQGRPVGQAAAPFDPDYLIHLMFGQVLSLGTRPAVPLGAPALELKNVTFRDLRLEMTKVSLSLSAGEVIGVAGLEGSGQRLLMRGCVGLLRPATGVIEAGGHPLTHLPYRAFVEAGIAFMPADRLGEGLVPGLSIAEHLALAERLQTRPRPPWTRLNWSQWVGVAQEKIREFNIKGRPDSLVEALSGGNQQRALISLLPPHLRLLIMEHPTRGLDVESALYIWGMLLKRREEGTAILFSSADLDEVFQYSDRILVCFNGQITAILNSAETNVEELGYLIAGKQPLSQTGST